MTRTGAAVRLDMEAAAAAFPDGLSSARSGQDASFDVGALGHDGAAQNVPGSVAEVGKECGTDERSKTPMLHASDWSLDDWLTSHRRPEVPSGVEVDKIAGVPCYKDPNSGVVRDARYFLPSSVMPGDGAKADAVGRVAGVDGVAEAVGDRGGEGREFER